MQLAIDLPRRARQGDDAFPEHASPVNILWQRQSRRSAVVGERIAEIAHLLTKKLGRASGKHIGARRRSNNDRGCADVVVWHLEQPAAVFEWLTAFP